MTAFEPLAVGGTHPDVGSRSAINAALNADIRALSAAKDVARIPVKPVFESTIGILVFVRDGLIDDDAFVGLAKYCVRACHALKIATEGRDVDSLSGPIERAVENLEKVMRRIKSEVSKCALGATHPWSTGVYLPLWKTEIQEILGAFGNDLELGCVPMPGEIGRRVRRPTTGDPSASTYLMVRPGEHSLPAPAGPRPTLLPGERSLQRLISGITHQGERISLIETICSSRKATEMVGRLRRRDAQTFIDAVDEALESPNIAPRVRRKCLKSLYKACTGHALLPRSLQVHFDDNPTGVALYRGGFGDVWKREYQGQEVAVKVVRTYADSDLKKITRRFCREFVTWKTLRHPNVLPLLGVIMSGIQLAMVSEWMPNGNIDQYVKAHRDVDRFELLADVAKGLIYMHSQGMVHGDLKGANILIDNTGHARLADFGLLAIISDATSRVSSSSIIHGGTYRWMSPELFYPENFGLTDSRPTKHSDCYALGMVIYEVLSGRVPFPDHNVCAVVAKVSRGERPGRPQDAGKGWFTDSVWMMVQSCWTSERDHRPKIEDVLRCLEEASDFWTTVSPQEVAYPSTTNSSSRNFSEQNTEGSTEGSGVSSTFHVVTPEPSTFAHQFDEPPNIPIHESDASTVEEDWDGPILFARPTSITNDSDADLSLEVDETADVDPDTFTSASALDFSGQDQRTLLVSEALAWGSPLTFAKPSPSSHKHASTKLTPSTYLPKRTDILATSEQRGRMEFCPQDRTQPTPPYQSDLLLQSQSAKAFVSLPTVVEPSSSSHEYSTDSSSTTNPVVPLRSARRPAVAPQKQRRVRKSPRRRFSRDHIQRSFPRRSDHSLRTTSGKSLLSTLVEPPSSIRGHDTPLPTPTLKSLKSLALLSILAEPPSSFHEYDTDSSSSNYYPIVPTDTAAPAAPKWEGGMKPHPYGVLQHRTQPAPWQRKVVPQPPGKSLVVPPTPVDPQSFYHGYGTDSSSSTYRHPVIPPRPDSSPVDHTISNQGGGEPHSKGFLQNRTLSIRWRPQSRRPNTAPTYPYSPSPDPQRFSVDGVPETVPHGDTRRLWTSRARRGRFGRTWKDWLRSSLGKLFGNPGTPP